MVLAAKRIVLDKSREGETELVQEESDAQCSSWSIKLDQGTGLC
jgi:hypothetical protein